MTRLLTPDICVIGGGSAGLTVAAAAASFGVSVVLVEKDRMGGDCLNTGCVPSKALIAAAKHAHAIGEAPAFGVTGGPVRVDFMKVRDHVQSVIAAIAPNDSVARFTALGVAVIQAAARFSDARTVLAGDAEIRARRFVIATGSRAFVPPIPGLAETPYLTNETIFEQVSRPEHLIVIGGGPIGMEMAQAHRRLGSKVTVVEGLKALSKDDPELAALVLEKIREEGVTIHEDTKVVRAEKAGEAGCRLVCEGPSGALSIEGSHLLVATGRAANVDGLGLKEAGIEFSPKGIKVGPNLKTTNGRVFAIGDVAGGLQFTHVAGYHAGLVVQQILFRVPAKENRSIIPWATYTDPELAHVGMSEAEARKAGLKITVLRWPYSENDRAQAERRTTGLIKVVADRRGRILGATIAGAGAGEMINIWALAIAQRLGVNAMRGYVAPYPTMAEIGKRAAVSYFVPMTRKPLLRRIVRLLARLG